ncbi:MAG: Gfo/Idh/MocA family protein [Bacillota bacterium]
MARGSWPGFCLVGVGRHARNQLIPAIEANGQALVGLVSRQEPRDLPVAPLFKSVEDALNAVPPDAAFLIASPPRLHLAHCLPALVAGRDAVVEKPAFVSVGETRTAIDAAASAGALLVEGFMHRNTRLYAKLLRDWGAQLGQWQAIEIVFVLPSLPSGTFRQGAEIGASVLYDIGCYALSLLADLAVPLAGLALGRTERAGTMEELLFISGRCGGIDVKIEIGVDGRYENAVTLRSNHTSIRYSPFFSGRPVERTIVGSAAGVVTRHESFGDVNGFMEMLAAPRSRWARTQQARNRNMLLIAAGLEQLGAQLAAARASE